MLASTLFHEVTHAYLDKFFPSMSTREQERIAYSIEWRFADNSLRNANRNDEYSTIWNYMWLNQKNPSYHPYPY